MQNRMGAGTETGRRNCGEKFRDSELKLCFECFDPPQHLTNNKIEYKSSKVDMSYIERLKLHNINVGAFIYPGFDINSNSS